MKTTPDYIDSLSPNEVFVFGSNTLGYHTGGASYTARKLFGAVWGEPEGLFGQSYAIPVDYGKGVVNESAIRNSIDKFLALAKERQDLHFMVTRIGCGMGGFQDKDMAQYFKEALNLTNISLPRSFIEALQGKVDYKLDRFVEAQDGGWCSYKDALAEIKQGQKRSHWIWYIFPQIKGLGHSYNSEFFGISGLDEAKAYLKHELLGYRLREITEALLELDGVSADEVFGFPDNLKVCSCMTLFDLVSPHDIFDDVLDKYYEGKRCEKTLLRLHKRIDLKKKMLSLSRLKVTKECHLYLVDMGNKEVAMEPLVKAVYLLFLKHPEGIVFKSLPDFKAELRDIYMQIKGGKLGIVSEKSMDDITNPLNNSINEKCSRIRATFLGIMDDSLANQYYVTGRSGEKKVITLPRNMIIWE